MQSLSVQDKAKSSECEKVMNDFSKLRDLVITDMKNLKSFCTNSKISEAQPLFNHQVIFPVLEILHITGLPNITEIWDMQSLSVQDKAKSSECEKVMNDFSKLRDLVITDMKNLKSFCTNSKISEAQPLFNHQVIFPVLEILHITGLPNITEIWDMQSLSVQDKAESSECEKVMNDFSKLRDLVITDMKNLKSFCTNSKISEAQPLFNHQVIFPVLETLHITGLPNITEIWDMQSHSVQDKAESSECEKVMNDFSKLRDLVITDMKNLKSFCTNSKISEAQPLFNHQVIFPVLEILHIKGLPNITEIWDMQSLPVQDKTESSEREKVMNAKELANDDIFVFSQLWRLKITDMKNLKSFCTNSKISKSQPLFNHQVVFPALEELVIIELPQITQIFDKELLTEESFHQLKDVRLKGCKLLVDVFPSNMLSRLQNLQSIYASSCENMEVIISIKREEEYDEAETKDNIILLPHLRTLLLNDLNNLKSFYSSRCEAQPLFNKKVIFPALEKLYIKGLPNITEIWDMQLLSVQDKAESSEREKVMNVKELANDDIFVFSQLRVFHVGNMKIIKSFCTNSKISKEQPLFNHQVAFPSLEYFPIEDVPNITEI
ncbi:uncharacterized protein LOC130757089 [Actinidia eriantha]|uniref:uncharacterized protein LOC130757089 n=1 Tax=Actinidia eriantha TaxID=165200 RepID=UPI00258DDF28|nr:uncharacterized protein LOC130757089 [Actinidia eriantha]